MVNPSLTTTIMMVAMMSLSYPVTTTMKTTPTSPIMMITMTMTPLPLLIMKTPTRVYVDGNDGYYYMDGDNEETDNPTLTIKE